MCGGGGGVSARRNYRTISTVQNVRGGSFSFPSEPLWGLSCFKTVKTETNTSLFIITIPGNINTVIDVVVIPRCCCHWCHCSCHILAAAGLLGRRRRCRCHHNVVRGPAAPSRFPGIPAWRRQTVIPRNHQYSDLRETSRSLHKKQH